MRLLRMTLGSVGGECQSDEEITDTFGVYSQIQQLKSINGVGSSSRKDG